MRRSKNIVRQMWPMRWAGVAGSRWTSRASRWQIGSRRWVTLATLGLSAAFVASLVVVLLIHLTIGSKDNFAWMLSLVPVSWAVAVLVTAPLVGRIGHALARLEARAGQIAAGEHRRRDLADATDVSGPFAQLEQTLDQIADALERATTRQTAAETKGRQLIGSISRELRTPLCSLQAMIEAVADGVITDPATLARYQHDMRVEVRHLTTLMDEAFGRAQVESAEVTPRLEPIPVGELAARAVDATCARAQRLGVSLTSRIDGAVPLVSADAGQMSRVLNRLLENAIRHTPAGGMILIRMVNVVGPDGHEEVLIQVIDTGDGIPASRLSHIFAVPQPDDTSKPSMTDTAGERSEYVAGTHIGFGLPLAARVVQAHGGRLWAESPLPPDIRLLVTSSTGDSPSETHTTDSAGTVVSFTLPVF